MDVTSKHDANTMWTLSKEARLNGKKTVPVATKHNVSALKLNWSESLNYYCQGIGDASVIVNK